jgi:general secretion pathway protein A
VVLAGQPGLAKRLEDPCLSQLKQRVSLWCELRPLTLPETAAYMLTRIRCAGGVAGQVFTSEAVTQIHAAAKGIPRVINVIADNALMSGLALEQRPVNRQIVRDVCRDLHIGQQPDAFQTPEPDAQESAAIVGASADHGVGGDSIFKRVSRRIFSAF